MKLLFGFVCGINAVCALLCYRAGDTRGMFTSLALVLLTLAIGLREK